MRIFIKWKSWVQNTKYLYLYNVMYYTYILKVNIYECVMFISFFFILGGIAQNK